MNQITQLNFDCYGTLIDWERDIPTAAQPLCSCRAGVDSVVSRGVTSPGLGVWAAFVWAPTPVPVIFLSISSVQLHLVVKQVGDDAGKRVPECMTGWLPSVCYEKTSRLRDMKILLQHVRTQLYLRSLGNWTVHPLEGYDFQHSQRAIDFAREHGISGVQIAVKFIDSQYDEVFPLPTLAAESSRVLA